MYLTLDQYQRNQNHSNENKQLVVYTETRESYSPPPPTRGHTAIIQRKSTKSRSIMLNEKNNDGKDIQILTEIVWLAKASLIARETTVESRRASDSRELKQPRRRRRVRRQVKNEFIFYQRNLQLSISVRYANDSKNVLELIVQWRRVIPMEIRNIIRRRPPSVQDAESGHFIGQFIIET